VLALKHMLPSTSYPKKAPQPRHSPPAVLCSLEVGRGWKEEEEWLPVENRWPCLPPLIDLPSTSCSSWPELPPWPSFCPCFSSPSSVTVVRCLPGCAGSTLPVEERGECIYTHTCVCVCVVCVCVCVCVCALAHTQACVRYCM
jgi:hypothetical protein